MKNRYLLSLIVMISLWTFLLEIAQTSCAAEQGPMAFVHANLIPMATETVLPDHTVIVDGDRITAVGPSSQTDIPSNSTEINCQNAFLMPGLADMHMHLRYNWLSDTWPVSPLKLYLANGVTTIRCFGPRGKTGRYGLTWRKKIKSGDEHSHLWPAAAGAFPRSSGTNRYTPKKPAF